MLRVVVLVIVIATTINAAPPATGALSSSQSQGAGAPGRDTVTWNQSQHGKYNIQVSLKDVKIVAVINSDYYDDDDDDDDYEYEYEDIITGVEQKPTTESSSEEEIEAEETAVTESEGTKNTTIVDSEIPAVLLSFMTDGKPENISQLPTDPEVTTKKSNLAQLYHRKAPSTTTKATPVTCDIGFVKDPLGRCRKIRRRRPYYFPFKLNFPGFGLSKRRMLQRLMRNHQGYASRGTNLE